jgi:hypothetical protein
MAVQRPTVSTKEELGDQCKVVLYEQLLYRNQLKNIVGEKGGGGPALPLTHTLVPLLSEEPKFLVPDWGIQPTLA